jgi:hypothetical protein
MLGQLSPSPTLSALLCLFMYLFMYLFISVCIYLVASLCWVWTQGLVFAREAVCHMSHNPQFWRIFKFSSFKHTA